MTDRPLYVDVCVMMLGCLGYQGRVIYQRSIGERI